MMIKRTFVLALFLLSTSAFAQQQTADLTLFRHTGVQGPNVQLYFYNYGNIAAQNVTLTVDYPAPLTIDRLETNATQCDRASRPLRCTWDTLPANAEPHGQLRIEFDAPPANTTYTVTAEVRSDTPDANPNNQRVTYTFETRIFADIYARVSPELTRVDPGATQVLDVDVSTYSFTALPQELVLKLIASPGMTIEKIDTPWWTCTIQGGYAECRAPGLDDYCRCGDMTVTVRTSDDARGGLGFLEATVTADIPDDYDGNNTGRATVQTYHRFVVRNNADAGEGSLRAALEEANQSCSPAPCKILFDMPSPELQTITPATPLPAFTGDRLFIDGGGKITIDGSAAHHGLQVFAKNEAVVQGLTLRNFSDQGLWVGATNASNTNRVDQRRVTGNTITNNFRGLRLDGAYAIEVKDNVISDNVRSGIWSWDGKWLRILGNRIERNGASGIFLGPQVSEADVFSNIITGHPDMGIAVANGASPVHIQKNSMRDNRGLGIDWGLDGVSPSNADDRASRSNAPVILSAVYDAVADRTNVTMALESAPIGYYALWNIDVYANTTADADGEQWIATRPVFAVNAPAPSPFVVHLPGDWRGKWINATSTRVHSIYLELYVGPSHTSEFSNSVRVD